jgi:prevent-host-death family protein
MREIGAFEAKNRLGQLLDWVEAGEEVIITRRGRAVARMVPANAIVNGERALGAAARIRACRRGVTLGGMKVKDLINEGRPWTW